MHYEREDTLYGVVYFCRGTLEMLHVIYKEKLINTQCSELVQIRGVRSLFFEDFECVAIRYVHGRLSAQA